MHLSMHSYIISLGKTRNPEHFQHLLYATVDGKEAI
jgi:hypothetical protein